MERNWSIAAIGLFLLVTSVGASVITVEPGDGAYLLVFNGDQPYTISAYSVQIEYDPETPVTSVEAVGHFEVFSSVNNSAGIMRIAGFTPAPPSGADLAIRVPLARIQTGSGFRIKSISIEVLDDGDRNPIPVEGRMPTPTPTTPLPPLTQEGVVTPAPSPAATVPPEIDLPWVPPTPIEVTGTVPPVTVTATETIPATGGLTVNMTTLPATVEAVVTGETPNQSTSRETPSQTTPLSPIPVLTGMLIAIFMVVKRRTQD